jgi:hypothetical protein
MEIPTKKSGHQCYQELRSETRVGGEPQKWERPRGLIEVVPALFDTHNLYMLIVLSRIDRVDDNFNYAAEDYWRLVAEDAKEKGVL